jgi:endoglucanase
MKSYRDVSGGWHDAGDFRKWVSFTLYGMIGLNKVAEILGPEWNREQILEELRWGNRYFLNMQNVSGYVMNYCGGDDGMYLSDNEIGTEDDRPIHTEPASFTHNRLDRTAQYNFIQAQALTSRIFQPVDPEYSRICLEAAIHCYEWCYHNFYANTALEMGAALMAYMELYKTSGDSQFLEEAIVIANRLMAIQIKKPIDATYGIQGFFKSSSRNQEPSRHSWHGPQHILGLCMLFETIPDHADALNWKEAIRLYSEGYVAKLTALHTFNLAPLGLYLSEDPGGNNKIGEYWIRYLSITANNAWGGGINPNSASTGIGLLHASRILKNENLKIIAQRQLDWIVGSNPLNMSTVEEVGRNQPIRFINRTWNIPPLIPGAVMNGIGGTIDEQAHLRPGSWQNCEYWTPPTSYTMWLMAELQNELK